MFAFDWKLDPILLDGAPPLRYYSLFLSAALIGGYFLWLWQMRRAGHSEARAARFLAYGLAGVIVGARLLHCLVYDLRATLADPLFVFRIWRGGLASHGALIGLLLALMVYCRRSRLTFSDTADRLSFSVALGAALVRIGNFFNSEIVGRPTGSETFGVRFFRFDRVAPVSLRHPVQLYEAVLALGIFGGLLAIDHRLGDDRPPGLLAALLLTLYFGGRLLLERYKAFLTLDPGATLTMGQWLSIAPALSGMIWLLGIHRPLPAITNPGD